jgi:hypothetical protein
VSALERAERDAQQGDLGSARRRLCSYVASVGYSGAVCEKLARLSIRMNDPVEAGRWYFLCDSADIEAPPAIERFRRACGTHPRQIYGQLPARLRDISLEGLPAAARERIAALGTARRNPVGAPSAGQRLANTALYTGCTALFILAVISALVGVVAIIDWVARLFWSR